MKFMEKELIYIFASFNVFIYDLTLNTFLLTTQDIVNGIINESSNIDFLVFLFKKLFHQAICVLREDNRKFLENMKMKSRL